MSFLNKASKGKIERNDFILLYGIEGVGKSSFAADAPNPYFIDIEKGTMNLDVTRITPPDFKTFSDILNILKELQETDHEFKTLAIDSLDHLEPLIWADVCEAFEATSISDQDKLGYGRGYQEAVFRWEQFLQECEKLRDKMNVILIAHCDIKTINDPMKVTPYDKFEIKLNRKAAALVKEKVEAVLFATSEIIIKEVKGSKKGKALGDGKRMLLTQGMPGHEGKNRYNLPYQIDLSWASYQDAKSKPHAKVVLEEINLLVASIPDGHELKDAVIKSIQEAKDNESQLLKILNRLQIRFGTN